MNEKSRILVVDDEESIRGIITETLTPLGYEVDEASSAEDALEILQKESFDLVLSDIRMEGLSGLKLLKSVKGLNLGPDVIIMTSFGSLNTAMEAIRDGAYDYLLKPFEDLDLIASSVNRAIERRSLSMENVKLMKALEEKNEALKKATKKGAQALAGEKSNRGFIEKILQSADSSNPLQQLLMEAVKLFRIQKAGLWIVEPGEEHLRPVQQHGLQKEQMLPIPFPISNPKNPYLGAAEWMKKGGHRPYLDEIKKLWGGKPLNNHPLQMGGEAQGLLVWTGPEYKENSGNSGQETFFLISSLVLKGFAPKPVSVPTPVPDTVDNSLPIGDSLAVLISDKLTPFYSFEFFRELLDMEIKRSRRYRHNLTVSLVVLDHPGKGHKEEGFDHLIHEISVQIQPRIRNTDFVTREGHKLFFALPETEKKGSEKLIENLEATLSAFREQNHQDPLRGKFTWKTAALEYPRDSDTIEGLVAGLETLVY